MWILWREGSGLSEASWGVNGRWTRGKLAWLLRETIAIAKGTCRTEESPCRTEGTHMLVELEKWRLGEWQWRVTGWNHRQKRATLLIPEHGLWGNRGCWTLSVEEELTSSETPAGSIRTGARCGGADVWPFLPCLGSGREGLRGSPAESEDKGVEAPDSLRRGLEISPARWDMKGSWGRRGP